MRSVLEEEEPVSMRWDTSGKRLRRRRVSMGVRRCPECHGDGVVHIEEQYIAVFCPRCKGDGYVEEEKVGETISYSSGKVPERNVAELVRGARERHAEAGSAMSQAKMIFVAGFVPALCDALEERERLVQAWGEAVLRIRSAYPEDAERDAESADLARRICDSIVAEAKEIFEASEERRGEPRL